MVHVHREQVLCRPVGTSEVTAAKALGGEAISDRMGGLLKGPQQVEEQAWMPFTDPRRLIERLLSYVPGPAGTVR